MPLLNYINMLNNIPKKTFTALSVKVSLRKPLVFELAVLSWVFFSLSGCHFETRPDIDISQNQPYRCGVYHSYIYETETEHQVYPDTGVIVANAAVLKLTPAQKEAFTDSARSCYEQCESQKQLIHLEEERLKELLKTNKIKGDMSQVAHKLNEIEAMRINWLREHRKRYEKSLEMLTPRQLMQWLPVENNFKAFPPETLPVQEQTGP